MIEERTGKDVKDFPILEEPQLYTYVLLNDAGKVKVGITKNINQRIQSLSGSNGAGNTIIKCYCSIPGYLYTIERIMHSKMDSFRIPNTEWFYCEEDPRGERLFSSAVHVLDKMMKSDDFKKLNELRKSMNERKS